MRVKRSFVFQIKTIVVSLTIIVVIAIFFLLQGSASTKPDEQIQLIKTPDKKMVPLIEVKEDSLKALLGHFMTTYSIQPPKSKIETLKGKLIVTLGYFGSDVKFYNNPDLFHSSFEGFRIFKKDNNLISEFERIKINGVWYIKTPSDILYTLLKNKYQ